MMEMGSSEMTPGRVVDGSRGSFPSLSAFAIAIHALLSTPVDEMTTCQGREENKKKSNVNGNLLVSLSYDHAIIFIRALFLLLGMVTQRLRIMKM